MANTYMARTYLDFEKPLAEIEARADDLRAIPDAGKGVAEDIARLDAKAITTLRELYTSLTPWQKKLVARHPDRPHAKDYIDQLIEDFTPLAGDRSFADDEAIIGGFGRFRGESICIIAQEKGSTTESRIRHNFGMAKPDGYRKAVRLMETAERFNIPVLSLVDTSGAYPGIDAEERGQAEAIARSTAKCLELRVPNIAVVIGEGGSGGAIALAATSVVLMLEHAIYSVISPEGAASILWRDSGKAEEAATTMRITAQDLLKLGIIDSIIAEPLGGAHRGREEMINRVGENVSNQFARLSLLSPAELLAQRRDKFINMGKIVI
jgi:acetyl-CoA carboxylase carboxyl transferase subunit alpha